MNLNNQAHENEKLRTALENLCDALDRMGLGSASDYPLPGEYDTARSLLAGAPGPKLKLTLKPCGDCWLHIDSPSGLKASLNLGQRGGMNDQTIVGRTIREVAALHEDAHEPDCGYTVTGHDHNCSCAAGDNLDFSKRSALMGRGGPRRVDVLHFAYIVEMLRECTGSTAMEYPEYRNAAIKAADYLELLLSEVYRLEAKLKEATDEAKFQIERKRELCNHADHYVTVSGKCCGCGTQILGELSVELGKRQAERDQWKACAEKLALRVTNMRCDWLPEDDEAMYEFYRLRDQ